MPFASPTRIPIIIAVGKAADIAYLLIVHTKNSSDIPRSNKSLKQSFTCLVSIVNAKTRGRLFQIFVPLSECLNFTNKIVYQDTASLYFLFTCFRRHFIWMILPLALSQIDAAKHMYCKFFIGA